jgi:hypothetical protein
MRRRALSLSSPPTFHRDIAAASEKNMVLQSARQDRVRGLNFTILLTPLSDRLFTLKSFF